MFGSSRNLAPYLDSTRKILPGHRLVLRMLKYELIGQPQDPELRSTGKRNSSEQ
jgi:hypothetical protein